MKRPDSFLTNTTTITGRSQGQAKDNPGDNSGTGMVSEIYNDPAYSVIAMAESWKEGGLSDSNETTDSSDLRDAIEEMVSKKVSGVSDWVVGTSYSAGDIVIYKGFQFVSYLASANIGNDPITNPDKWYKIPTPENLLDDFFGGLPKQDLSPIADRSGTDYQQNIAYGEYRLGGNADDFYDFFRVHLDGTQVTGDATLEAIFDVGGANEYFNIDLIAPDVLGTRTLIDMGGRYIRSQSGAGDVVPTMGTTHDDAMQKITGRIGEVLGRDTSELGTREGVFSSTVVNGSGRYGSVVGAMASSGKISFDNSDSVSPNTAKTDDIETKVRSLVVGCSYIVIMQPA